MVVELVDAARFLILVILVRIRIGLAVVSLVVVVRVQVDRVVHIHHRRCNRVVLRDHRLGARTRAVNNLAGCNFIEREL